MSAEKHKQNALKNMNIAYVALRNAQNELADVRGVGMSDIYSKIADIYCDQIDPLIEKLKKTKATELSGF